MLSLALADRIQQVLPDIVSADQTAYVKGRNITQNIRIVQDAVEYPKQKKCKKYYYF